MIESCPRCGVACDSTIESTLEPGQQLCVKCAEEEVFKPGKARKKIIAGIKAPLMFTEAYRGEAPPPKRLHRPENYCFPVHLGHALKNSMAICSYHKFPKERITNNPNEVTCLNCLKRIQKELKKAIDGQAT